MNQVNINNAIISVSGRIDFDTVVAIRHQGEALITAAAATALTVDLGAVEYSDTSGLSLLLVWLRCAKQQGKTLQFSHLPESLLRIANSSGIKSILAGGETSG